LDRRGGPNKAALVLLNAIETGLVLPGEMWVPDRTYGYVARLDRHGRPDKVTPMLLLPSKKARQKEKKGALKVTMKSEVLIP